LENQSHSPKKYHALSITGLLLLLIPVLILGLWIGTFNSNPTATQAEKVAIYMSKFPSFLRNLSTISLIIVGSAIGSILFTIVGRKISKRGINIIDVFVIIVACLIMLLQLFSML
jgi:hypothetical protein